MTEPHVPNDRLDSWKEVAAYLDRDIRTVQRWERTEGLPIKRHVHGERGSVYAFKPEIDAWLEARRRSDAVPLPIAPPGRPGVWIAVGSALVVVTLAGVAMWLGARPTPSPFAPAAGASDPPRLFDELTREGGRTTRIRVGKGFHAMALSPDDKELYVGNYDQGTVSIIDTARGGVVATFVALEPASIAVNADGTRVYVGQERGDIIVLDTRSRKTSRLVTPGRVKDLALSPDGRTLYIAGEYSGVLALSTQTGTITTVSALACPMYLALSPEGQRLVVSYQCNGPGGRRGHDAIDVLDTATGTSVGHVAGVPRVGGRVSFLARADQIWTDGGNACVEPTYDHEGCPGPGPIVNVIRASDRTVIQSLTPGDPDEFNLVVAGFPDGRRAIAGFRTAYVYNTATFNPVESMPGPLLGWPVFSQDGRIAYLPIGADDTVIGVPMRRLQAPPAGVTGRWTGDGTTNDLVGLSAGVIDGAVVYAPGIVGRAFSFGGNGMLRIDGVGNLGIERHPFTVAAWIKPAARKGADSASMTILDRTVEHSGRPLGWRVSLTADNRVATCFASSNDACGSSTRTVTGRTPLEADRWHLVVMTWQDDRVRLFLDGRVDAEKSVPGSADDLNEPLRAGNDRSRRTPFHGAIDEIEVYDRALTPAEIAARASIR